MANLRNNIVFETAFATYTATAIIGEGGNGRVYAATQDDGHPAAVKLLTQDRSSREKRSRFKNELAFLLRTRHPNIVQVLDHGLSTHASASGPFYVMPRFDCSLRDLMLAGIPPHDALPLFLQLLDGVEAAHLIGVVHRDIKPENVLCLRSTKQVAVADFGVARFQEDLLATAIETAPTKRLANFQYAAPEQRVPGGPVTAAADVYALGLILNELFTGLVPHGSEYKKIRAVSADHEFLDEIVDQMTRQTPASRPRDIAEVKILIQRCHADLVSRQRLSIISQEVVPVHAVDDPLAIEPVRVVGANWDGAVLTLTLDKRVSQAWVQALRAMGNCSSVMSRGPEYFRFSGNKAMVEAEEHEAQDIITHFKNWMPMATTVLRQRLEGEARREEHEHRERLRREREAEERRLRVNRSLKI